MPRPIARRAALAVATCVATTALTASLVGIATTEGKLRPDGPTAILAAQQRDEQALDRRCPLPQATPTDDVAL